MDSLVTNGVLLNRKTLSILNNLGVTNLTIRIDSANSSAMDALRGKGTFKRIIYNAGQAIKMGFKVFFSTTVCKLNFREIDKMIGLAKEINAVNLSLDHIFYHGRSICYADILKLSPEEEREALFKINELSHTFGSYITGDYVRQIDFIKILEKNMLGKKYICIDTCGAGNKQIFIRSDGWVAPCPAMRNIKLGNINERSLTEIWGDVERFDFFRRSFCLDLVKFHDCKSCIYQELCYTRCRCYPYFLPTGFSDKSFYCIVPGGSTEPIFKFKA